MKKSLIATLILILSGCATQSDDEFTEEELAAYNRAVAEYEKYSAMQTPSSWRVGKKWIFIYVNDNEVVNRLIVEPTSETVRTYVSGDWKRLKVTFEQTPMKFEHFPDLIPAYTVKGRLLTLMMAGNISHTESVNGRFDENGFVGQVRNGSPYCFDISNCKKPPKIDVFEAPLL